MAIAAETLSLAELEAFDPRAPLRGKERRFFCPLVACTGKNTKATHRCLCVNIENGAWNCQRCKATGKLKEWWEERPKPERRRVRHSPKKWVGGSVLDDLPESPDPDPEKRDYVLTMLRASAPLDGTPGEAYLTGRSIPLDLARRAARWHPDFIRTEEYRGRPGAVFSIRDEAGEIIAAQACHTDGKDPSKRVAGEKRFGVYATPGIRCRQGDEKGKLLVPVVAITETPIDALSLAACGLPALALIGTSWPKWLPKWLFRSRCRVFLATDADEAGDQAAEKLTTLLRSYGVHPERLRPDGAKDWNELLQRDPDALRALISRVLGPAPTLEAAQRLKPRQNRTTARQARVRKWTCPRMIWRCLFRTRCDARRNCTRNCRKPRTAPNSTRLTRRSGQPMMPATGHGWNGPVRLIWRCWGRNATSTIRAGCCSDWNRLRSQCGQGMPRSRQC